MARDKVERIRRGEMPPGKRSAGRAFCTIPTTVFGAKRVRCLPGCALRVLLWCEGGWHPDHGVIVPQRRLAADIGMRRMRVTYAIRLLIEAELLTLLQPAVRPRGMGCNGPGRAAVFDLPHRRVGAKLRFDQGDLRLPGYVKLWANDARSLARELSDAAARVAIIAAAVPRASDGTPLHCPELDMSGDLLTRLLPGMTSRTANRAVAALCALGDLKPVKERAGQRGARYAPAGRLSTCITRRRRKRSGRALAPHSGTPQQAWLVHGGSQMAGKSLENTKKAPHSGVLCELAASFRAKPDAENPVFAPFGMPKENLLDCNDNLPAA